MVWTRGYWINGTFVGFSIPDGRALPAGWEASPAASWGAALAATESRTIETTVPLRMVTGESMWYRMHRDATGQWQLESRVNRPGFPWHPEFFWDGRVVTLPWRVAPTQVWNLTIAP